MNCRLVASFWELEFSLDPQNEFIDLTQVRSVQSDVEVGAPDPPQVRVDSEHTNDRLQHCRLACTIRSEHVGQVLKLDRS
jgi:hypothetical protein